jgi:hypothetical protein
MEDHRKRRKENATPDTLYYEAVVQFTVLYYTVRVWVEIPDIEGFEEKVSLEALRGTFLGLFSDGIKVDQKTIAKLIVEVPYVNAVEVKFSSQNSGIVLYKNWP